MKHKPIIIGVAGGTASGKSTLVRRLQETFVDEDVVVLSHDYYYKAHDELPLEQRAKLNYDHPEAFDTKLMCEQFNQLCEGHSVERPVYSFVNHNRIPETVTIEPPCVLIIDGILIFENEELRDLMDVKIYVQTDDDVRLARRIQRDVKERGRSVDSVIEQYLTTVKPMHQQFVEPSRRYADLIIPEGGFNSVAVRLLIDNVRSLLSSRAKH